MSDDDLTTAYMAGYHKRDDEVAALKAEIERLHRNAADFRAVSALGTPAVPMSPVKLRIGAEEEPREMTELEVRLWGENAQLKAEIERLRLELGALLAVTVGRNASDEEIKRDYGMLGFSVVQRVREALGEL